MSTIDDKTAFFIQVSLVIGRPRGLGDGMMQASILVGGKGAPRTPTMSEHERGEFIALAIQAGMLSPPSFPMPSDITQRADRLIQEYRKWYEHNEPQRL